MGLFDKVKADSNDKMNPQIAFATSLIYMIAADGVISPEEVGQLLLVLGAERQGNKLVVGGQAKEALEKAKLIVKSTPIERFLAEVTPLLNDAQRLCVLINLADSLLADGTADPAEQALFEKFLIGFDVSEERIRPYLEVISVKNDRSVFTDKEHPSNADGYVVELSL